MCAAYHRPSFSQPRYKTLESLPKELLDVIFDDLCDDIATLKTCSMLSHTLLPVCQAYIFHTVTLEYFVFTSGPVPIASHARFLNIISDSPHLTSLVRELRFTEHRTSKGSRPMSEDKRMVHQKMVTQILVALPQLRTLKLQAEGGLLAWGRLSAVLTTALFKVAQLPTLHHLDLGATAETPASFFRSLTNLQALCFGESGIPPVHGADSLVTTGMGENPSYGHLRSLSILSPMSLACIDALFLSSAHPLDISHVTSLALRYTNGPAVRQMLKICGKSINSLDIDVSEQNANDKFDFGFGHLQRMTSLTISFSLQPSSPRNPPVISWLAKAISILPSPERLERLAVIFEIWWAGGMMDWSEAAWGTLRRALAAPPRLHSTHVLIYLTSELNWISPDRCLQLASFIRERIGQLANTQVLQVKAIQKY